LRATRPQAFNTLVMVDANDAKAQTLDVQNHFVVAAILRTA
jgi:hypothetical protein